MEFCETVKDDCRVVEPTTDAVSAEEENEDADGSADEWVDFASTLKPTTRLFACDATNGRSKGDGADTEDEKEPDDGMGFDDCRVMTAGGCGGSENP